jgi:hypothetical protein
MNVVPPRLPDPTGTVTPAYMAGLLRTLRLFFVQLSAVRPAAVTSLNIDIDTLPTQADLADLRRGDVYRDTSAGDVLKIKV